MKQYRSIRKRVNRCTLAIFKGSRCVHNMPKGTNCIEVTNEEFITRYMPFMSSSNEPFVTEYIKGLMNSTPKHTWFVVKTNSPFLMYAGLYAVDGPGKVFTYNELGVKLRLVACNAINNFSIVYLEENNNRYLIKVNYESKK